MMQRARQKVVVAMSGGVDSSVAACLLVEQGYEVVGLFMRTGVASVQGPGESATNRGTNIALSQRPHQGCCSASDAADARYVAGLLDIAFYALNFQRDFEGIIDYFSDEYARGRTPNPCVVCNDRLKFGRLVEYADHIGADAIATGHYARIERRSGRPVLFRARDRAKDQSYVLFGLDRSTLDRVMFPIGDLEKSEVRQIAARLNLPNRDKPDSVDICFVPDRDYARVVEQHRPEAFREGDMVDGQGRVLGRHRGVAWYTVGQRRGLGVAVGYPLYVTDVDADSNTITVGSDADLLCEALIADRVNFLVDLPDGSFRAQVKIRYLHEAVPATVHPQGDKTVRVVFDEPQRAVTPGQAAVFYDGDVVIGGGWIDRSERCPHAFSAASVSHID